MAIISNTALLSLFPELKGKFRTFVLEQISLNYTLYKKVLIEQGLVSSNYFEDSEIYRKVGDTYVEIPNKESRMKMYSFFNKFGIGRAFQIRYDT